MESRLVNRLKELLGAQLVVQGPETAWPLLCRLLLPNAEVPAAVYLAGVGQSGRPDRPFERRIQNPSGDTPIVEHSGRVALLIGIADEAQHPPVLVAWDADRRRNRTTRYSAFVHEDDLNEARSHGRSARVSASGETIYVFQPPHLEWAVDKVLQGSDGMDLEELDYEGLATGLAALSEGECPSDFSRAPTPFEPADIDWDNGWLMRVAEVQAWLALDDELRPEEGAEAAATQLFRGLAMNTPEACFNVVDGQVRLTQVGLSSLTVRVSTAEKHKAAFQSRLDEEMSVKEATRQWRSLWEDEPDLGPGLRVSVHASVDVWKVKDIKDAAECETLDLSPSYQRDLVWSTSDSQKLIESMLRGIPLPSIILNQRKNSSVYEIVDGKQRLTAILRFIGCHPTGVLYAQDKSTGEAPLELCKQDYKKWRRKLGIQGDEERANCLPFMLGDFSAAKDDPLAKLSKKYYYEIANSTITIQGQEVTVRELFERTGTAYKLPVIIYQNTDLAQIHQVFGLYNKQGKQLNAEELRNAVYHHLGLTKLLLVLSGDSDRVSELAPFVKDLPWPGVAAALRQLQVRDARFHRTKLASWVTALLVHTPTRGATPSTAGFINAMLDAVGKDRQQHPMSAEVNLKELAFAMLGGASLLQELSGEEQAFVPKFSSKKADGVRWEDLPVVATWTACTLAFVSGVTREDAPKLADAVRKASAVRPTLEKQQSRSQWGYIARTVRELLDAMGVDEGELDRKLKQKLSFSCLSTFREIDELNIPLR